MADLNRQIGKLHEAEVLVRDAIGLADLHDYTPDKMRLISSRAGIQHDLGNYEDALDGFHTALAYNRNIGNSIGQISQLHNIAVVLIDQSKLAAAETHLQQALKIAKALNHHQAIAHTYRTMGVIALERRFLDDAEKFYYQALKIDQTHHFSVDEISDWGGLADVLGARGKYSEAIQYLEKAEMLAADCGLEITHATQLNGLATMYERLGMRTKAANYYQEAYQKYYNAGFLSGIAAISGNLGWLNAGSGYYREARRYLERAASIYHTLAQPVKRAGVLTNIAFIDIAQADYPEARKNLNEALSMVGSREDTTYRRAQILSSFGNLYQKQGALEKAKEYQDSAIALVDKLEAPRIRWRMLSARGSTFHLLGNRERVINDFKAAISEVEAIRAGLGEENYRIGFFGDDPLSIYTKIIFHLVQYGDYLPAIEYVELARSRTLVENLSSFEAEKTITYSELQSLIQ